MEHLQKSFSLLFIQNKEALTRIRAAERKETERKLKEKYKEEVNLLRQANSFIEDTLSDTVQALKPSINPNSMLGGLQKGNTDDVMAELRRLQQRK